MKDNTFLFKNFKKTSLIAKKADIINLLCKNKVILITSSNIFKLSDLLKQKKIKFKICSLKNNLILKFLDNKEVTNQFIGSTKLISIELKTSSIEEIQKIMKSIINEENIHVWGLIWKRKIYSINRIKQIVSIKKNEKYNHISLLHNWKNILKKIMSFSINKIN